QEKKQHGWARKLGRAPEAGVGAIEAGGELRVTALERILTELGRRRRDLGLAQLVDDGLRRGDDLPAPGAPQGLDTPQERREARPTIPVIRRKIRGAEKRLQRRGEEDRHRPAARARGRLYVRHVDAVDVGALLAVDLDGDEMVIQELRDRLALEGF